MLEKSEAPGREGTPGADEDEEAEVLEVDEGLDSADSPRGRFKPCRITTKVSKPSAAFTTSWRQKRKKGHSHPYQRQCHALPTQSPIFVDMARNLLNLELHWALKR